MSWRASSNSVRSCSRVSSPASLELRLTRNVRKPSQLCHALSQRAISSGVSAGSLGAVGPAPPDGLRSPSARRAVRHVEPHAQRDPRLRDDHVRERERVDQLLHAREVGAREQHGQEGLELGDRLVQVDAHRLEMRVHLRAHPVPERAREALLAVGVEQLGPHDAELDDRHGRVQPRLERRIEDALAPRRVDAPVAHRRAELRVEVRHHVELPVARGQPGMREHHVVAVARVAPHARGLALAVEQRLDHPLADERVVEREREVDHARAARARPRARSARARAGAAPGPPPSRQRGAPKRARKSARVTLNASFATNAVSSSSGASCALYHAA